MRPAFHPSPGGRGRAREVSGRGARPVLKEHLGAAVDVTVGLGSTEGRPDLVVLGPGTARDEVQQIKGRVPRGVRLVKAGAVSDQDLAWLLSTSRSYLELPAGPPGGSAPSRPATKKEQQWRRLYELIEEGRTNQEIGDILGLTVSTVKYHITRLLEAHGLKGTNRRALVRFVSQNDLAPPPPPEGHAWSARLGGGAEGREGDPSCRRRPTRRESPSGSAGAWPRPASSAVHPGPT